jgi:hypothetical protein
MANSSNISKTAVPVDISYAQFYIVFIRTQYHWHGIKAGVYCRHCSPIFSKEEDYIQRSEQKGILGADLGGGAHPARAPPKIGKNMIFWRKIVIFHTKYPKNFRASLCNWKKYDFWRKIVIFHTKYPKNFRASLRSVRFF